MILRFTCIIPFYNEKKRISNILSILTKITLIKQIICIDDGSEDNTYQTIKNKFPNVDLIKLNHNHGKSEAIRIGLAKAKLQHILLFDADVRNIKRTEITYALKAYSNGNYDMTILKRIHSIPLTKFMRGDVLLSGERILKKIDLEKILKTKHTKYQIELAINDYMIKHRKKTAWTRSSAISLFKILKWGLLKGIISETKMYISLITFSGLRGYWHQYKNFCSKEA